MSATLLISQGFSLNIVSFFSIYFLFFLFPFRFFPFFLPLPYPIDSVSPNRCLKARHKADSFEPAELEWSERRTSRQGRQAGCCRRRSDYCSCHFLLSLLSFQTLYFPIHTNFFSIGQPVNKLNHLLFLSAICQLICLPDKQVLL